VQTPSERVRLQEERIGSLGYVFVQYNKESAGSRLETYRFVSCVRFEVIKLPEARHGFVLLPKRWVVERSFGRAGRFCRLAWDEEQLAETLAGLHLVAFAILMLRRFVELLV